MKSFIKLGWEIGLGFWFAYTALEWLSYGITKIINTLISKGTFL